MAVSLEARVPYLDPDLVSLAFQAPKNLRSPRKTQRSFSKNLQANMYLMNVFTDQKRDSVFQSKIGLQMNSDH